VVRGQLERVVPLRRLIFDDLHFERRPYDPWEAYGQSQDGERAVRGRPPQARWASEGITSNALMPGAIRTNLQRHLGGIRSQRRLWKTTGQGASTLGPAGPRRRCSRASAGAYFADNQEALVMTEAPEDLTGVAAYAPRPGGRRPPLARLRAAAQLSAGRA